MAQASQTTGSFGWAILGTGAVSRKFAFDARAAGMGLAAVASRDLNNAAGFAADLGVPVAVSDVAQAIAAPGVDAVYVATPVTLHEEHALAAIAAGKPVLVEKPFAHDTAAAQRIAAAARAADVFCMEAMWTRFQPLPLRIKDLIKKGKIGTPIGFEGRFLSATEVNTAMGAFDAKRGGGALLHRGVYPLSIAQMLLGPAKLQHVIAHIGETSGVDEDIHLTIQHDSGARSTMRASTMSFGPEASAVYGTEGWIEIEGPIWRPTGAVLHNAPAYPSGPAQAKKMEAFRESSTGVKIASGLALIKKLRGKHQQRIRAPFAGNGYQHEAIAVRDAVAAGLKEHEVMPLDESIAMMQLVDAALENIR